MLVHRYFDERGTSVAGARREGESTAGKRGVVERVW